MTKMFLDKKKTLHTCKENSCQDCEIPGKLVCHFDGKKLTLFLILNLPLFLFGGYCLAHYNRYLLIPWILFMIAFFGLIEIRVMCSHCPHYAEPELRNLKCWANYGSPKLWKYRPGPMNTLEKIIFVSGLIIIFLSPIIVPLLQGSWSQVILYLALFSIVAALIRRYYCSHCINFACPLNVVDEKTRNIFLEKNPIIKKAWTK